MRILILSDHFHPDLSSGGRLWTELSAALVERGEMVSVLTAFSSYNSEFAGSARDVYRGINIRRVASTRFARKNLAGRLSNEVSFCISVFSRAVFHPRPDVILTLSSPPFLPLFVTLLSKLRRIPFVYVMYDVFPDIAVQTGLLAPGSPIVKFWGGFSKLALRNATRIVVIGRCMQEVIETKIGSANVPIDVIHNWSDSRQLYPISRSKNPFFERFPELRDKFIVQYSGNLGRFQDFETILGVAEQLLPRTEIHFLIIGDGFRRQWLTDEIDKRNLLNVSLLPFQPQAELIYSLNAADVSLVTLERGAEGLGVPSKFYPILAVGKPVVAVMHTSAEVARTVREAQVGEVVRQGDVSGLAAVVRQLAGDRGATEEMGVRSLELFLREFDLPVAVQRYQRVLERAATA